MTLILFCIVILRSQQMGEAEGLLIVVASEIGKEFPQSSRFVSAVDSLRQHNQENLEQPWTGRFGLVVLDG